MAKDWGKYKGSASYAASARGQTRRDNSGGAMSSHPNFAKPVSGIPVKVTDVPAAGRILFDRSAMVDGRRQGLSTGTTVFAEKQKDGTYSLYNEFIDHAPGGRGRQQRRALATGQSKDDVIKIGKRILGRAKGQEAGGRLATTAAEARDILERLNKPGGRARQTQNTTP